MMPCLDMKDGRVVKGVNLVNLKDARDPMENAGFYESEGADELAMLDIASCERCCHREGLRSTLFHFWGQALQGLVINAFPFLPLDQSHLDRYFEIHVCKGIPCVVRAAPAPFPSPITIPPNSKPIGIEG